MEKNTYENFKPETKNVREIFDSNGYYEIPDYQRPYSWEDDQIEELLEDIFSAIEDNDEN
ncbi:MAG: DUF262 domain-containing protein [Nanoarchaeota archaeon]